MLVCGGLIKGSKDPRWSARATTVDVCGRLEGLKGPWALIRTPCNNRWRLWWIRGELEEGLKDPRRGPLTAPVDVCGGLDELKDPQRGPYTTIFDVSYTTIVDVCGGLKGLKGPQWGLWAVAIDFCGGLGEWLKDPRWYTGQQQLTFLVDWRGWRTHGEAPGQQQLTFEAYGRRGWRTCNEVQW